ncbi:hypothetical protein BSLG_008791 [Batrachochytrium salamandrivorans]|nr:hypothetical protein BASA62_008071 [Batrachochytrium salamandrivorans]KAH6574813.1 hypothetical protein BASA60_005282 [Batrachochytrium salamandrivorans]KAJ1332489.1 hypothetical protein BSLG_008791 [Batrachochytrium salamandrivorans]
MNMSVKGKAKNTAKGNRKSKSSKRGESHSTPVALRTNEEAVPFLTLVMIESHKFAIQNYRQECYTAKSEYNSNRELFRRIESEHYSRIKSVMLDTDHVLERYKKLEDMQEEFQQKISIDLDPVIQHQMNTLTSLELNIKKIKGSIEASKLRLVELTEFQQKSTEAILDQEILNLRIAAEAALQKHKVDIEDLNRRHELSIFNTARRTERIINAAESVASQHQLDILPDSTLHEELLNRQLKKHLISVKQDRVRYEAIEQSLEQENMELIRNHLKVGWNLSSEVIKVLSDGSVINVHGWGAQVPDPEIVMSCNTIREYGHEAQVAQLCPIAQVVHSELPVPCTSTVGKSNSISDPRIETEVKSPLRTDLSLPSITPLKSSQRLRTLNLKDLNQCIRDIIQIEVHDSDLDSPGNMGIRGKAVELKAVPMNELGPTKYY